jgi:hypothetical protein
VSGEPLDFAVVALKSPVMGASAFPFDASAPQRGIITGPKGSREEILGEGANAFIHISSSDDNFRKNTSPSITLCEYRGEWLAGGVSVTDCDTYHGSSGAAELLRPKDFPANLDRFVVMGIHVASSPLDRAGSDFEVETNSSDMVRIDSFFAALWLAAN